MRHAASAVQRNGPTEAWAAIVAALAALYLFSFDPFARPTMLDPATWEYMSLALLDGRVPYRDIFLHKTPGALFLGGGGARIAAALGAEPLAGVRACFLLLGALAAGIVFLLCLRSGHRATVGLAAAFWLLAYDQWSLAAIEGARPKVATTTLGLLCLLLARRRPLLGGVFGGASVLCWQPGLCFLAAAAADARDWRAADGAPARAAFLSRLAAGAALPAVALGTYLASHGALGEFFEQAVRFNLRYIEGKARPPSETLQRLGFLLAHWNRIELCLIPLAGFGALKSRVSLPSGLMLATVCYLTLTFVSLQAWPDTILLAPGIAAFLAIGLSALAAPYTGGGMGGMLAALLAIAVMAGQSGGRFDPPVTLEQQRQSVRELAAGLSPQDPVYVVSCPEFLVLTHRHSVLRWPYMWFGVDRFAADATAGGFDGILAQLEAANPRLMLVCRRWNGDLRRRFEQWARQRYTSEQVALYPHTRRPMVVYRKRGS